MADESGLQVYQTGELTVVGFGGRDVPDDLWVGAYREDLYRLVRESGCTEIAFDLTGVRLLPSGMLGLLASLREKLGVAVRVYNPSPDVREALEVTQLDKIIGIGEVET